MSGTVEEVIRLELRFIRFGSLKHNHENRDWLIRYQGLRESLLFG